MGKLSVKMVDAIKDGGKYDDGDGLRLIVTKAGSKNWVLRIQKDGKRKEYGLGGYPKVSLKKARELAQSYRENIEQRIDPLIAKQAKKEVPTFQEAAIQYHRRKIAPVRSAKYGQQWLKDLKRYIFPQIGRIRVDGLNTRMVVDCIEPYWVDLHVTAKRMLQRIIAVADYSDFPLAKGAVVKKLSDVKHKPKNHAAMAYADVADFMKVLRTKQTMSAFALEALILTAVRSQEIRGARWCEIDETKMIWTIPADRMKAKNEHIVPITSQVLEAFKKAKEFSTNDEPDLIFESAYKKAQLSDMTLSKALKDWGYEVTPHGFRSTFRDWIGNETMFDGELAEMALAHTIKNQAERAYRRGNMLEKRRELMTAWANHCEGNTTTTDNVIKFERA